MWWILLFPLAFAAAKYIKIFGDYGSNYLFCLAMLFLIYGSFSGFFVWLFGWFFLWLVLFQRVELGVS